MTTAWTIPHLLSRVINTPLLLLPDKAELIRSLLIRKASGESISVSPEVISSRSPLEILPEGLAIIDIHGTTVHRTMGLEALSGLTSYEQIRSDLYRCMADERVHSVLLNIDSPGGEAAGAFDLADVIRDAAREKRLVALAEDQAASGGYLLGSQAGKLFATQSASTGSVGVYLAFENRQQAMEASGIMVEEIISGDRKADGSPFQPLSDEARAVLQARADDIRSLFVAKVAASRGLSVQAVWDTQAGVFLPKEAKSIGLIDDVATMEQLVEELSTPPTGKRSFIVSKSEQATENMTSESAKVIQISAATPAKEALHAIQAGAPEVAKLIQIEERTRITNIRACAFPGQEALVAALIEEGASHGDAAVRLNRDYQDRNAARIAKIRSEAASDEEDLAGITSATTPESHTQAISTGMTDDQIKQAYQSSPQWQKDFPRIESFLVYAKNHPEEFRR